MDSVENLQLAGIVISNQEWLVIGVVIAGLAIFELGPKALNLIKNRRSKKPVQKN